MSTQTKKQRRHSLIHGAPGTQILRLAGLDEGGGGGGAFFVTVTVTSSFLVIVTGTVTSTFLVMTLETGTFFVIVVVISSFFVIVTGTFAVIVVHTSTFFVIVTGGGHFVVEEGWPRATRARRSGTAFAVTPRTMQNTNARMVTWKRIFYIEVGRKAGTI